MRILLIGNFAPPYEEESLHNLSLLNMLKEEDNDCCVINISENPSKEKEFIDSKNFFDFVFKLMRCAWKKDVVHFLTKGYLRLGLLKLMTSILIGRLFRAKSIITIHSELFSIMGQMRSPVGGRQTLFTSFSLAHKIIFADKDTYEATSIYKKKSNFELIPSFIYLPAAVTENKLTMFKKLEDKKKVIVFSNVKYPSFLLEILNSLLSKSLNTDIGFVVSLSEKLSAKLQHAIEETGEKLVENLVFIESDNMQMLSMAYARADLILRPLSCDGKMFFSNFTVSLKKPVRSANFLYFPNSLLFVKEGETADLCTYIINDVLKEKPEELLHPKVEDNFYAKIKNIYFEK